MPHEADLDAMALSYSLEQKARRQSQKDLFDEGQGIYPPAGTCLACEYGPAYRHNWIEGQCDHASEEVGDLAS